VPQPTPLAPVAHATGKVDDAALLRKIADGDVSALGVLFDQTARQVYSLVMQLLRNHDIAEDIVESTFWQVWREAAQLADMPEPREWLLRTGRQKALDHLRSRRRQRDELLMDKRQFSDLVSASADEPSSDESQQSFLRTVRDLASDERQILELGYFRGLSQTDISDLTGESAATVKSRMRSALEKLRSGPADEVPAE
jgi:RNA polymerase sigma-70 factor (ECF subfamily)